MPKAELGHILESQQFSREFLEGELFPRANRMEKVAARGGNHSLRGVRTYNLFYEPSTRTRVSFETAAENLGAHTRSTENAAQFSSAVKGETLEDTVKIIEGYGYDAIILRHKEDGAATRASQAVERAFIINAGDGAGQHPTQALLDVGTIYRYLGGVDGTRILIAGDLEHGRTANSLAYLTSKFRNVSYDFVAPEGYGIQQGIKDHLDKYGLSYTEGRDLKDAICDADVVYMTRPQLERHNGNHVSDDQAEAKNGIIWNPDFDNFILTPEVMSCLRRDAIVMHPLPRTQELPDSIMDDPRVIPFEQAKYGLYTRMALFEMMFYHPNWRQKILDFFTQPR